MNPARSGWRVVAAGFAGAAAALLSSAAWAELLFSSPRAGSMQLYAMADDGSALRALTRAPGDNDNAVWSPDGRRIAFVSTRDGRPQIYVMNADGSAQRRLSGDSETNRSPAWSPDSRSLVYASARDGRHTIVRADLATGSETLLTRDSFEASQIAWSPGGDRLAFVVPGSSRDSDLMTLDLASGAVRRLMQTSGIAENSPVWSPDGTQLAYVVSAGRKGINLHVMKADGSEPRALTDSILTSASPAWSPDGRWIAFVSNVDSGERGDIFVVSPSGGAARNLTRHAHEDFEPNWSADSSAIYFTSFRTGVSQIYRVTLDGVTTPVSQDRQYAGTPLVRPSARPDVVGQAARH